MMKRSGGQCLLVMASAVVALACSNGGGSPGSQTDKATGAGPELDGQSQDSGNQQARDSGSSQRPNDVGTDPTASCTGPAKLPALQGNCEETLSTESLPYPFSDVQGMVMPNGNGVIQSAVLSNGALFASFETTICDRGYENCKTYTGLFKTQGAAEWERVLDGTAKSITASVDGSLYIVSDTGAMDAGQELKRVDPSTQTERTVQAVPAEQVVAGLSIAGDNLYSLTTTADFASTTLNRRGLSGATSLGPPMDLQRLNGWAGLLQSHADRLAWAEQDSSSYVVSDLSGKRLNALSLPPADVYHGLELEADYLFAAYTMRDPAAGALCSLDLDTGEAELIVTPEEGKDVCAVAANSTHVLWSQSAQSGDYCNQVWSMALAGGAPRLLSCATAPVSFLLADGQSIYWFSGSKLHYLKALSL